MSKEALHSSLMQQQEREERFAASMDKRSRLNRQYNYAFVGEYLPETSYGYNNQHNTRSQIRLNRNQDSYYSASFKQIGDDSLRNIPPDSQNVTLMSQKDQDVDTAYKLAVDSRQEDVASVSSM